jgi:cytochrome c biogenesis protein CcmG, thiol:disulfide interchange protein DsbE
VTPRTHWWDAEACRTTMPLGFALPRATTHLSRRDDGPRSYANLWGVLRRLAALIAALALAGIVVLGLVQASGNDGETGTSGAAAEPAPNGFDLDRARARLQGSPAALASLHAQSSELLGGGRRAFDRRLEQLEGRPVVINKWASWCGPCRFEFPFFQQQALARGREVAFLGVNASDNRGAAKAFLREYPVPYPSYVDPDERIARSIDAPANYPVTVFIDATGKTASVHQGGYRSEAALAADIERYLG